MTELNVMPSDTKENISELIKNMLVEKGAFLAEGLGNFNFSHEPFTEQIFATNQIGLTGVFEIKGKVKIIATSILVTVMRKDIDVLGIHGGKFLLMDGDGDSDSTKKTNFKTIPEMIQKMRKELEEQMKENN